MDHKFNDHNLFFARYDYNKVNTFTPPGLGTNAATGLQISGGQFDFDGPATDTAQQYGFGFTHIFTQNLLVDLRAAFTRINNLSLPLNSTGTQSADAIVSGGLGTFASNLNSQSTNLTPISFPGLSDIGDGSFVPLQDIDNNFQYLGTVSWTKGSHNIKFGASLLRRQARNVQSPYVGGQYTFGLATDSSPAPGSTVQPSATQQRDNGIASALTGAFSGEQRQVDLTAPDYRTWEPSFFVQDSWKVTPKLTVLYGVRYDLFTPFTEAHNRISNFDFFQALSLNPSTVTSALKIANVNGVDGHAGISTDYSNVAPRLGFAYSAFPGTIIRGGFGVSYFPGNYTSNTDLKNVPFLVELSAELPIGGSDSDRNQLSRCRPQCWQWPMRRGLQFLRSGSAHSHSTQCLEPAEPQPALVQHGEPQLQGRRHRPVQPASRAAVRSQRIDHRLRGQRRAPPAAGDQRHQPTRTVQHQPQ